MTVKDKGQVEGQWYHLKVKVDGQRTRSRVNDKTEGNEQGQIPWSRRTGSPQRSLIRQKAKILLLMSTCLHVQCS